MFQMKFFVTGVAGYIGSSFAYEALRNGYQVVGIDNLSNPSTHNLKILLKNFPEKFQFVDGDILDFKKLIKILSEKNVDTVFHFAALKCVPESEKNPKLYYKNNVEGTKNLISAMKNVSVKKLIFSSSAAVYGDQLLQPIKESALLYPKSIYAETKKECEDLINEAADNKFFKSISLRYFNPIGSHESKLIIDPPNNVSENIMSMINKVALGERKKLTIFGNDYETNDGTGERDYIHISDLVDGHFKAFEKLNHIKYHETYNLGTGKAISVLELINTFKKVNNIDIKYHFAKRRIGDLARSYADPAKANIELNWHAKYGLQKMCKDAWEAINNGVN